MRTNRITSQPPVGVILAGGPGTRIGGNKASVALNGEPLLQHTLRSMRQVLIDVAIITKPQTVLPRLEGAMIWVEPDQPLHPLLGVGEALALAGGRSCSSARWTCRSSHRGCSAHSRLPSTGGRRR